MYDIVYDTGTSLAVQVLAFDNVNLKTCRRYLERLDEEFIERSGTWVIIGIYIRSYNIIYYIVFKAETTFLIILTLKLNI